MRINEKKPLSKMKIAVFIYKIKSFYEYTIRKTVGNLQQLYFTTVFLKIQDLRGENYWKN